MIMKSNKMCFGIWKTCWSRAYAENKRTNVASKCTNLLLYAYPHECTGNILELVNTKGEVVFSVDNEGNVKNADNVCSGTDVLQRVDNLERQVNTMNRDTWA